MSSQFDRSDPNSYPSAFSAIYRNYGHWDIITSHGRAFRIRGGPGEWVVFDERSRPSPDPRGFKDQAAAMAFICAEMMHELLATENQTVTRIEDWNVSNDNPHLIA